MTSEVIQLIGNYGVVGLIFYLFIKEFFSYLNRNKNVGVYSGKQDHELSMLTGRMVNVEELVEEIRGNHLVHLNAKVDSIISDVAEVKLELTKFSTILEERLPKN